MAGTTTVVAVKAALIAELIDLNPVTSNAVNVPVQIEYGRPELTEQRREAIYWGVDTRMVAEPEERITGGRRRAHNQWEMSLMISCAVYGDVFIAEQSAMELYSQVDDWLAEHQQPHEWPHYPIPTGALWVKPVEVEMSHRINGEDYTAVDVEVRIRLMERVT